MLAEQLSSSCAHLEALVRTTSIEEPTSEEETTSRNNLLHFSIEKIIYTAAKPGIINPTIVFCCQPMMELHYEEQEDYIRHILSGMILTLRLLVGTRNSWLVKQLEEKSAVNVLRSLSQGIKMFLET